MNPTIQSQFEAEVEALHVFFEAWLGGKLPQTTAEFARFENATAPDFTLISPDGTLLDRAQATQWIWGAYNTRPDFRIWIEHARLLHRRDALITGIYEEWQENAGVWTVRLSTALLEVAPAAPNGLHWLHVHETWLARA